MNLGQRTAPQTALAELHSVPSFSGTSSWKEKSVEFSTNLGQMAMRPERSHSGKKNAYEGSTINENERN